MKFGRRTFSVIDMIGDGVEGWWRNRHLSTWEDFARRLVKLSALVLVGLALVHVLYPTQRAGWLLWLGAEKAELAHWTAVVLVGVTAIIIPLCRYAWDENKGLAFMGGVFAVALVTAVLMGGWNYYAYASGKAVNTALAATGGAEARIAEATRAMEALDAQAKVDQATFTEQLARSPANAVTARSRIMREMREASEAYRAERQRLEVELKEARAANVGVQGQAADPRPIDVFIADAMGHDRNTVATGLDLFRSAVFELLALLFVSLGTTAAMSRMGAPVQARPEYEGLMIEDKTREKPITPDLAGAEQDIREAVFEDIKAKRSEAAKKGWQNRMARMFEKDKPPPLSDTDPRVVRKTGASDEMAVEQEAFGFDAGTPNGDSAGRAADASVPGAMEQSSANEDGGPSEDAPRTPDTADLIAPPLSQEQAQALVDSGTHEYVTDEHGDRWLREIEREAQQGAADEIGLGEDGKSGVMKAERADG